MISFFFKGDLKKTKKFLKNAERFNLKVYNILKKYGELGLKELQKNTPVDTGATKLNWRYEVTKNSVYWISPLENGVNVAILLEYGWTNKGINGEVKFINGKNFITPAIKKIFTDFSDEVTKELNRI